MGTHQDATGSELRVEWKRLSAAALCPMDACPAAIDGEASSGDRLRLGGSWHGEPLGDPDSLASTCFWWAELLSGVSEGQHMTCWEPDHSCRELAQMSCQGAGELYVLAVVGGGWLGPGCMRPDSGTGHGAWAHGAGELLLPLVL